MKLDVELLKKYKRWYLMLSGGTDSTLLMLQLMDIHEDEEFIIVTGVNGYETVKNDHAVDIVKLWKPRAKHILYENDHLSGQDKKINDLTFAKTLDAEGAICIQGRTKNPPFNIPGEDPIRNHGGAQPTFEIIDDKYHMYRPYINNTKKDIMKAYKDNRISNLLSYTRSCINLHIDTCGKCFWCKEREWATTEIFGGSL